MCCVCVCLCVCVCFIQSPLNSPYTPDRGFIFTVADTCCAHAIKAITLAFHLLPLVSHHHCHYHIHYLLSFSSFLFAIFCFPLKPLCPLLLSLSAPLQTRPLCRWTNFTSPYANPHTQAHAPSQTEARLLNGAAAREIRVRLHYEKKLADFIKDCSVNKRTGCPD